MLFYFFVDRGVFLAPRPFLSIFDYHPLTEIILSCDGGAFLWNRDVWETGFLQQTCSSLTYHVFDTPPTKVYVYLNSILGRAVLIVLFLLPVVWILDVGLERGYSIVQ